MSSRCPALISLLDRGARRQRHWWLADGGSPQRIARLLASPGHGPAGHGPAGRGGRYERIGQVFGPLPRLPAECAGVAARRAAYRYLIQLGGGGLRVSCWRRYGDSIGWQRRCGPMALGCFLGHFGPGSRPRLRSGRGLEHG